MLFTVVWTGVLTTLIALAIKFTIGWRITPEDEVEGIDFDQHGETAYDFVSHGGSAGLNRPSAAAQVETEARGVNA